MSSIAARSRSAAVLALCLLACDGRPAAGKNEIEIPTPILTDVDPDVVEAIRAARAEVERDPSSSEA